MFRELSLEEVAAYLECACVEITHDLAHSIVHIGTNAFGRKFALMNNASGQSVVTEG